ncbi:Bag domain, partial [Globisporangium polare]
RLPANAFNMDHATQKLNEDDGTLEIHMPYRAVQHQPSTFGSWSVFDAPKSIAW